MRKSASSGGVIALKRQNEEDSSEEEESPLVVEERTWLSSRLDGVLTKVRNVLAVFGNDALANDDVFEEALQAQSLNGVLDVLRDVVKAKTVVDVFISFFTDDEWSEMEASDRAIDDGNEAQIRLLRLKRQHALLFETRDMAIDLTAIQNEGEEQGGAGARDERRIVMSLLKGLLFCGIVGVEGAAPYLAVAVENACEGVC